MHKVKLPNCEFADSQDVASKKGALNREHTGPPTHICRTTGHPRVFLETGKKAPPTENPSADFCCLVPGPYSSGDRGLDPAVVDKMPGRRR